MAPINVLTNWMERADKGTRQEYAKRYFVCEGVNTEAWYFGELFAVLDKQGLPQRFELELVERTEEDIGKSSPVCLARQAARIRGELDDVPEEERVDYAFDPDCDRTVLVFDADVYAGRESEYRAELDELLQSNDVAVTWPCFELYLLLHAYEPMERWIAPNTEKLLDRRKGVAAREARKLVTESLGVNPKTNSDIRTVAHKYKRAIEQEALVNQDPYEAIGRLTSNVGKLIAELIADKG